MVPVESTAFALLSLCVILLAAVLFFTLVVQAPGNAPMRTRPLVLVALVVIAVLAVYVLVTTRMR